jgi:uncharacterized membrane protein
MVRLAAGIVLAVLVVTTASAAGGVDGRDPTSVYQQDGSPTAGLAQDFQSVTVDVTVYPNGTGEWLFTFRQPLNESTRPDFEAFAAEFNTTDHELFRSFRTRGERLESAGRTATGREMNVTGYSRQAYVDDDAFSLGSQGIVEMRFRWSGMAQVDGERVVFGDVFNDGFYLGPRFNMIVRPGGNLVFDRALPEPDSMADADSLRDSRSVSWEGEREFNVQRPLVELVPRESLETPTPTPAPTTTDATPSSTPTPALTATTTPTAPPGGGVTDTPERTTTPVRASDSGGGTGLVVGVVLLVLAVGTVVVWRVVSRTDDDEGDGSTAAIGSSPGGGDAATEPVQPESAEDEQGQAPVDEGQLLSDTDRVQNLLESNGGRMRQSEIVEETDWSKSKVSMLLSDMEDEDEITKLRVGRENLISLPGHEPEAAGSPFEDEE